MRYLIAEKFIHVKLRIEPGGQNWQKILPNLSPNFLSISTTSTTTHMMNGPAFNGIGGGGGGSEMDEQTKNAVKSVRHTCATSAMLSERWNRLCKRIDCCDTRVQMREYELTNCVDASFNGIMSRKDCCVRRNGFCSRRRIRIIHGFCTSCSPFSTSSSTPLSYATFSNSS